MLTFPISKIFSPDNFFFNDETAITLHILACRMLLGLKASLAYMAVAWRQ